MATAATVGILGVLALAPSARANVCEEGVLGGAIDHPFADWGDANAYVLWPGGDFESAAAGWKLRGGAALGSGGSPYRAQSQATALKLPVGSAAVSPPACVDGAFTHVRMFARTVAGSSPQAALRVRVKAIGGEDEGAAPSGGEVSALPEWDATDALPLPNGSEPDPVGVRIVLRPVGGSSWLVDDLFADPRARPEDAGLAVTAGRPRRRRAPPG